MVSLLVFVSGCIEVLFGTSAILLPKLVVEGVGGAQTDVAILAMIRLLGAATLGLGVGALVGRNWALASEDPRAAFGLGSYAALSLAVYNIVAAPVLILGAVSSGASGLWAGAALHTVVAVLFIAALLTRN